MNLLRLRRCGSVRGKLALFVGGDLLPPAAAAVRQHLLGCPACRAEASAHLQAQRALSAAAAVVLPSVDEAFFVDQHSAILRAVEAAPREPERRLRLRRPWLWAAAVLFGVGVFLATGPGADGLVGRPPMAGDGRPAAQAQLLWDGRPLQPLGHDQPFEDGADPASFGWMGRLDLRTLEAEIFLPVRQGNGSAGRGRVDPTETARRALPGRGSEPPLVQVPDDGKPRRR